MSSSAGNSYSARDVWVRHYVGRFGSDARADARKRLLDAGFGTTEVPVR